MRSITPEEGALKPLPVDIRMAGDRKTFIISVCDDVESAQRDGALAEMQVKFGKSLPTSFP